jgi:lipopolysaccharide transport system ATP-binding protein
MTGPIDIGIVGTFDVENYGDLLFPLLAQAELGRRMPARVVPYSYNAHSTPGWPYDVRAVADLADTGAGLGGLLVGGGQLVRSDTYFPIAVPPGTAVPYDIWLLPALAGLALGVPVVWNAIGAWEGGVAFAPAVRDLVAAVLHGSERVAVRDAITAQVFDAIAGRAVASEVPDTGFGLRRLVDRAAPSAPYAAWRRAHGITGPYVAIQATEHLAPSRAALLQLRALLPETKFVLLPICKVHGDRGGLAHFGGLEAVIDDAFLAPALFAEIIAHAQVAVGSSLHFGITAIAFGVPLLRTAGYADKKYRILDQFAGTALLRPDVTRETIARLAAAAAADTQVAVRARNVDAYWDDVAGLLGRDSGARDGPRDRAPNRRALAAWALGTARRQVAGFESAAVRFLHR